MERTVRISQLLDWQRCHRRHHLRRLIGEGPGSEATAKGQSFHAFVQAATLRPQAEAAALGQDMGGERWGTEWRRASRHLPAWLWEGAWASEVEMELPALIHGVRLQGHIDLMQVRADSVLMVEIKTGGQAPTNYLAFNLQHRFYALTLAFTYSKPIFYTYLMPGHEASLPCYFTPAQQQQTKWEVEGLVAAWLADEDTHPGLWLPTYSALCRWKGGQCDFADACEMTAMEGLPILEAYDMIRKQQQQPPVTADSPTAEVEE